MRVVNGLTLLVICPVFLPAPGMVEGIVVGVTIGFLFLVLMAIVLCLYKKDM